MRALASFHVRVGARLALRAAAPLAAAPVVGILLQQDPGAALRGAAHWLVGAPADPGAGLALALACLAVSSWAMQRIAVGQSGWLRHLPLPERTHRRAALLAAFTAQAAILTAVALLLPLAALDARGIAIGRVLCLPLTCAGAALAAWPARGSWASRALAGVALLLLAPAHAAGIAASLPLLAASERLCGSLASRSSRGRRRSSRLPASVLIALRALGPGALLALVPACVPLLAMTALRLNNDLAPGVARGAARFGGAFAVLFLLASLAERLSVRRPAWAWGRSLPRSAAGRVASDALILAGCGLVPIGATALLDALAALQVAGCVPALAFLAAGALHPRGERERSVAGEVLAVGAFVASGCALLPWLWAGALLATPLVARAAARREREQKVSVWRERHHRSVGDPLSWEAR